MKEKLPNFPTYENPLDKLAIAEVEELLKEEPSVKRCLQNKVLDDNTLHESVLNSLGNQREGPKKREVVQTNI